LFFSEGRVAQANRPRRNAFFAAQALPTFRGCFGSGVRLAQHDKLLKVGFRQVAQNETKGMSS
jgi:hypothetical protein